jgi:hypothetical protein
MTDPETAACLNRFRSATVSFGGTLAIDPRTDPVLITGAAGAIGTALATGCAQLAPLALDRYPTCAEPDRVRLRPG